MELKEKILNELSSNTLKSGEIAEKLNEDKKAVDKAIKELKAEEKIISPKRCYYTINK